MTTRKKILLKAPLALAAIFTLATVLATAIFTPDSQPIGYVGQPLTSNAVLASNTERVYAIDYSSLDWSGNMHSYPISSTGGIAVTDDWNGGAALQIKLQNFDTERRIVTMNGSSKIPFRWSSLSTTQQTGLGAATVLNYLRGDQSNEGTSGLGYRVRTAVFGDIIHSTPIHCNETDCTGETVFVGANDGMLHAINADDGTERFAYVPSMLINSRLASLKNSAYSHSYFVDGRLDLNKFGNQTILVGSLAAGGKGLFGIDVTNAVATSEGDAASKILWEISPSSTGFANLGYTYSAPTLITLPGGTAGLVIGNGYNNTGNGHAVLYIVNAATGALIHESDTGSGSTASPNGLSTPSFWDNNGDGYKDTAYAGDIDGHLWKFSLVSPYTVTALHTNTGGAAQAITMAPGLKPHPHGGVMVTFVTGRMFTTADTTATSTHYAYGIWDGAPTANDALLVQTLTEGSYSGVTPSVRIRTVSNNAPDWSAGAGHHKGWKIALPTGGERIVGDGAFIRGSIFQFMTTNPAISTTAVPPGENWWMQLNAITGSHAGITMFDLNKDGAFNTLDQVSGNNPVGRYMGGGVRSQLIALSADGFDVYQSNFDKNGSVPPTTPSDDLGVSGGHFDVDVYYNFATTCPTLTTDGAAGTKAWGTVTFDYAGSNTSKTVSNLTIIAKGETLYSGAPGSKKPRDLDDFLNGKSSTNYTIIKNYGNDHTIKIEAKNAGTVWNGAISVTLTTTGSSPGYTKIDLSGGADANPSASTGATGSCQSTKHHHEYDDMYDVTGLNMLDASDIVFDLANAIPATTTQFKVLAHNQYLSPAAKIHLHGNPSYVYNIDQGYVPMSGFITSSTLDVTNTTQVPTYTRATVNSLAVNLPVDAFKPKNWWGGALQLPDDVRVGLHPTQTGCVKRSKGTTDGNMYQPVIPPIGVTATGNGTLGYSLNTTSLTATGARHNGALTIQVIKDTTPNSAIEMNVTDRPEYGWRVKSAHANTYLLAEYTMFWHHPNGYCYGATGWTKLAEEDPSPSDPTKVISSAAGTDPHVGSFGSTTTTSESGTTTTTTTVVNADGTITVTTTVTNPDGTRSTTVVTRPVATGIETGGAVNSDTSGVTIDLQGEHSYAPPLGRINWREMQQ